MNNRLVRFFSCLIILSTSFVAISSGTAHAAVNTNNGTTLQINFGGFTLSNITDSSTVISNLGQYISRPSSGWYDTDTVALEIALTDTSTSNATVTTTGNCYVRLSQSISSSNFSSTWSNGSYTVGGGSGAIYIINDNTPAISLEGQLNWIVEALAYVKIGCGSTATLASRYLRMGIVPTLPSATNFDPLYYLFSTQHYYRYSHDPDTLRSGDNAIVDKWLWAKSNTAQITVDGTNKSGVTRNGWVATLNTTDEIKLTNSINISGSPMIGTTDMTTYNFAWDTTAWGGTAGTSITPSESKFQWLGPDAWGNLVPTAECPGQCLSGTGGSYGTANMVSSSAQYWKLTSGTWAPSTSSDYTINMGACDSNVYVSQLNGYGIYQAWHMDVYTATQCSNGVAGYRATEPNNSGSYIYQGYSGVSGFAGWDDKEATSSQPNMYVEYCSPAYPCPPPANAVALLRITANQTINVTSQPANGSTVSSSTAQVNAYSNSGLQLTYTIDTSTASACSIAGAPLTVDSGTAVNVSLLQANTNCTININQPGNANFNPASQVQITFVSGFGIVVDCSGVGTLQNGDFESFTATEANWASYANGPKQVLQTNQSNVPGWKTTASDSQIEIQRQVSSYVYNGSNYSGIQTGSLNGTSYFDLYNAQPASGTYWAELNANYISTLYQDIKTLPHSTIRWSIKHRGRRFSTNDNMNVKIGSISTINSDTQTPTNGSVKSFTTTSSNKFSGTPSYSTTADTGTTHLAADGTMTDTLEGGWTMYQGAYSVNTDTTTRFAFNALGSASTVGNYLDDIKFSPLVACPATFSVVVGRQVLINPFDINLNGNVTSQDSTDSFGWNDAYVDSGTTLTTTGSGTVSRTPYGGVSNRAILYSAPATTGTQYINFQITNPFGDISNSQFTVNVIPDSASKAISNLPIDPRATSYILKSIHLTTTTSPVLMCIDDASTTLNFAVGTYTSASPQNLIISGDTLTVTGNTTSSLSISGNTSTINKALIALRIRRVDGRRIGTALSFRVRSVPTGLLVNPVSGALACGDAISDATNSPTFSPITLTAIRTTGTNGQLKLKHG